MTTPFADASAESLMEDLQLHEVILQSLDEQRPDAIEERQEIIDTINGLQTQLAQLHGEALSESRHYSSSSHEHTPPFSSTFAGAQMDGSFDVSPFDNSPRGTPSPPPPLRQSEGNLSHAPFPIRKRRHDSELSDNTQPPTKRPQGNKPSHSSNSQIEPTQNSEEFDDGAEELRQLLGLDNEDTMAAFQDEQKKAEEWLRKRNEQERRDGEFARTLHDSLFDRPPASSVPHRESEHKGHEHRYGEPTRLHRGLFDQPRPTSAISSSSTDYSGSSLDLPLSPAQKPQLPLPLRNNIMPGSPSFPTNMHPQRLSDPFHSAGKAQLAPKHLTPFKKYGYDNEDVQEITRNDFRPRDQDVHNRNRVHAYSRPPPTEPPGVYYSPNMHMPPKELPYDGKPSLAPRPPQYSPLGMAPLGSESGPNGAPGPGPMYGPNVLQNTMARLSAGRQLLQQAGRSVWGGLPGMLSSPSNPYGLQSTDPIGHAIEYGSEFNFNNTETLDFLNGFYEDDTADPKKVKDEIKQLLETIRPDLEIAQQDREGTPEALRVTLLEHQKVGLSWMKTMEENEQKGGILADDMGLGKTIQALALVVSRPSTDPERKPTLVIAPVALMQQWKREIQRLLRPGRHQLSIFVLHGEKRSTSFRDLKEYDVVLTTFGTLASEFKRKEKYEELHKQSGSSEPLPRAVVNMLPCLGPTSKWHRIVVDEAQCIKNRNTKSALACCRLDATHRWCMSGTPMMNNVEELHSLLRFLRIRPYSNLDRFNREFSRPLKKGDGPQREKAMRQLQVLLKAVLLRRTKYSKIDGKPILQLPQRVSEKAHAVFNEDERQLYTALETQSQVQFNKYLKAGTVGRNYSNILVLLLRLRQACCHPHLMSDFGVNVESNANANEVDLVANAKAFGQEVIIRLRDHPNLECPICIDAVDNPIIFFPCGHGTCAECFSRISDPSAAVQQGHDGTVEVKCPNCRGKIDTKKITDRNTFKKVHFPDPSDEGDEVEPEKPDEKQEEKDHDETDSDSDSDSDGSLSRFIVRDDGDHGYSDKSNGKGKGKKASQPQKKSLAELKKEGQRNQKAKRKYLRRLEKNWISSAKIDKAMEILQEIEDRGDGQKTIVFSQFTSLLDLLEVPIARRGWGYRRYDGSMRPPDRNAAVLDFTDKPDCKIMLVSLKAGNSGLNLVAASQVIIFDPFWNPYIEEQAIDRAHRIGQQREVHVHRILVEKTVEDRILELQDKKREVIEGALDENASKSLSRLGTRELGYLFGVNA